jgi:hypothetical protein
MITTIKVRNGVLTFQDGVVLKADTFEIDLSTAAYEIHRDLSPLIAGIKDETESPSAGIEGIEEEWLRHLQVRVSRAISTKISDIQEMPLPSELSMVSIRLAGMVSAISKEGLEELERLLLISLRNYMTRYLRFLKDETLPEALRG